MTPLTPADLVAMKERAERAKVGPGVPIDQMMVMAGDDLPALLGLVAELLDVIDGLKNFDAHSYECERTAPRASHDIEDGVYAKCTCGHDEIVARIEALTTPEWRETASSLALSPKP